MKSKWLPLFLNAFLIAISLTAAAKRIGYALPVRRQGDQQF